MTEELKEMLVPELSELKIIIANKEAKLADRDAEIANLKRLLAEAGKLI